MSNKLFFIVTLISFFYQGCYSQPSQNNEKNRLITGQKGVDSMVKQNNKDSIPKLSCLDIVSKSKNKDSIFAHTYSKNFVFINQNLLLLTKDSVFYAYKEKECELIFNTLIEYPDDSPYVNADGSTIQLQDIDGDKQNEIFILVSINKSHHQYSVFRLENRGTKIDFKKINKIDEIINPSYDEKTGLIRSNWHEKDVEVDEYYKLDKNDNLTFVKGAEISGSQRKAYTKKEGW